MIAQLKEIHKDTYKAAEIHWMRWANFIAASDAHLREQLLHGRPPADLIEYFSTPDHVTLHNTRKDVAVSRTVNNGVKHDLSLIHQRFVSFREMVNRGLDDLESQIQQIEDRNSQTEDLLSAFDQDLRPEETPFGRKEYNAVQDQEDIDHVYTDDEDVNENVVEAGDD